MTPWFAMRCWAHTYQQNSAEPGFWPCVFRGQLGVPVIELPDCGHGPCTKFLLCQPAKPGFAFLNCVEVILVEAWTQSEMHQKRQSP